MISIIILNLTEEATFVRKVDWLNIEIVLGGSTGAGVLGIPRLLTASVCLLYYVPTSGPLARNLFSASCYLATSFCLYGVWQMNSSVFDKHKFN